MRLRFAVNFWSLSKYLNPEFRIRSGSGLKIRIKKPSRIKFSYTKYLFDIFPQGKTGDATYGTAADVAFYNDGECYAPKKDVMLLDSTDGAPASDAGGFLLMEPDPFDALLLESGTESGGGGDDTDSDSSSGDTPRDLFGFKVKVEKKF